jgi:hypothetical protein
MFTDSEAKRIMFGEEQIHVGDVVWQKFAPTRLRGPFKVIRFYDGITPGGFNPYQILMEGPKGERHFARVIDVCKTEPPPPSNVPYSYTPPPFDDIGDDTPRLLPIHECNTCCPSYYAHVLHMDSPTKCEKTGKLIPKNPSGRFPSFCPLKKEEA